MVLVIDGISPVCLWEHVKQPLLRLIVSEMPSHRITIEKEYKVHDYIRVYAYYYLLSPASMGNLVIGGPARSRIGIENII